MSLVDVARTNTFNTFMIFISKPLPTHPKLHSIDESPALVTLVTPSFWVVAVGTDAFNKAVGEKTLTVFASQLLHSVLHEKTMLVESPEYILGYPERAAMNEGHSNDYLTMPFLFFDTPLTLLLLLFINTSIDTSIYCHCEVI